MSGLWTVVAGLVVVAPSVVLTFACVTYAMRIRSRSSRALAIGAAGGLAVAVASQVFGAYILPRMYSAHGYASTAGLLSGALSAASIGFGLLFSVSLLVVLRVAWTGRSDAAAADVASASREPDPRVDRASGDGAQ